MSPISPTDELANAREELGIPRDGNVNGRTLSERARDLPDPVEPEEGDEPEQEELFVVEHGRRVPLTRLIAEGTPVEYSVNLRSKSFRGGPDMGLLPFNDPEMILVVPVRQGKVETDPTYSPEGFVEKVSIRVNFKPLTAYDSNSSQGRALLGLPEEE